MKDPRDNTRFALAPHLGHSLTGSALNDSNFSNMLPHLSHLYSYKGILTSLWTPSKPGIEVFPKIEHVKGKIESLVAHIEFI